MTAGTIFLTEPRNENRKTYKTKNLKIKEYARSYTV